MIRYSKITTKNKREIVLLKGYPCIWGRCVFCDYIHDNSENEQEMLHLNNETLKNVTGEFSVLEVINSGSVFELPQSTLNEIKEIAHEKHIERLIFESWYGYKDRLHEIRKFFGTEITFKCGVETFDNKFRNETLKKGILFSRPEEVSKYFESVCLLVGVKGQTKEMISNDIEILMRDFKYGCINLYTNNSTAVKEDAELKQWFKDTYGHLEQYPNIDVLWKNTGFGVGGEAV